MESKRKKAQTNFLIKCNNTRVSSCMNGKKSFVQLSVAARRKGSKETRKIENNRDNWNMMTNSMCIRVFSGELLMKLFHCCWQAFGPFPCIRFSANCLIISLLLHYFRLGDTMNINKIQKLRQFLLLLFSSSLSVCSSSFFLLILQRLVNVACTIITASQMHIAKDKRLVRVKQNILWNQTISGFVMVINQNNRIIQIINLNYKHLLFPKISLFSLCLHATQIRFRLQTLTLTLCFLILSPPRPRLPGMNCIFKFLPQTTCFV